MDPITMTYYALVCAVLSLGMGARLSWRGRLLTGALVGVAAAAALPWVRATVGV